VIAKVNRMVRQILPQDVKARLDEGLPVYLLDVRQPEEYAIARLPGSVLIPLGELPRRAGEVEPPTGAAVVVYCHHGIRSLSGAAILERFGIENVYSLAGGIEAWSQLIDPRVPRY
jgi:rhodanese-related sulfurtransferase